MTAKKSHKKYVVGYAGSEQCVYGPRGFTNTGVPPSSRWDFDYADRMSAWQARRAVRNLSQKDQPAIYELVPVDPKTLKRLA